MTVAPTLVQRSQPAFGRLTQIDLRTGWSHEAADFTPWLALPENLRLLADSIGVPLELQATEERIGPFSADIVCRCPDDDSLVLIENQIERTDHAHLGQLLTYTAGLEAATVVWIAARFTEEHRGALDWLNRVTGESLRFFGLEIELWRIGASPLAPKFNLVARPNEVVRGASATVRSEITPLGRDRQAYWAAFSAALEARGSLFQLTRETAAGHVNFPLSDPRYVLVAYRAAEGPGVFLRTPAEHSSLAARLQVNQAAIEQQLGVALRFSDDRSSLSKLALRLAADPTAQDDWPRQHGWLCDSLERIAATLEPLPDEA